MRALDRDDRVEPSRAPRPTSRRVAAHDVGLAEAGAQVVAGGDALLDGGGVVGPGHLLDDLAARDARQQRPDRQHRRDAGEREEEERRPPGRRRRRATAGTAASSVRAAIQSSCRSSGADLVGVVVDPVEDLADGLLAERGQRLAQRRVEQVGAQPALGAVDDAGPEGAADGVEQRPRRRRRSPAATRQRAGRRPRRAGPATTEPSDVPMAPTSERESAEDATAAAAGGASRRGRDPAPGRATGSARRGRVRRRCRGCSRWSHRRRRHRHSAPRLPHRVSARLRHRRRNAPPRGAGRPGDAGGRVPSDLELAGLEALLDVAEEAAGVGAVDEAVVVGQRQVDHVAHRDRLAEVRVVDHDRDA